MRNLEEININEGGEPVTRPQPTPTEILFVEKLVGVGLPKSYVKFLDFANGGHPEFDTFFCGNDEWSIDRFFHISSDHEHPENVVWNYRHRWNEAPDAVLPIARDGGGNLICLNFTKLGQYQVVLWIHDVPENSLSFVANSFEEFVDSLVMNPDYI